MADNLFKKKILDFLKHAKIDTPNNYFTFNEIARHTLISTPIVSKYIRILLEEGKIVVIKLGQAKGVRLR